MQMSAKQAGGAEKNANDKNYVFDEPCLWKKNYTLGSLQPIESFQDFWQT